MPTISVVIPVLDDSEMLARCLDDLAAQLRPADEIVVVDNGSTDETADVARAAGARVIEQPQRGIWPAASAGYDAATGDIIARLDADSRPPADWLLHIEAELVDAPEVGVLTGRGVFYDGNAVVAGIGQLLYIGGYFWSMELWLGNPPIFGSNFAMRRDVWQGRPHARPPRPERHPRRPRPLLPPRPRDRRALRRPADRRDLRAPLRHLERARPPPALGLHDAEHAPARELPVASSRRPPPSGARP